MRILIIYPVYCPEPTGYRIHDLAAGLVEQGHHVTVITGLPSYPLGRVYKGYRVRPWQLEIIDGVRIWRVLYIMDRSLSAFRRVISYTLFSGMVALVGVFLKAPDIILTGQIGLPGVFLGKLKSAPYVHEVQDLWPEWAETTDMGLSRWLFRLLDWHQMQIYQRANAIVTISNGFKRWLITKGVPSDKIEVIPNWARETVSSQSKDYDLATKEGMAGRFNVVYAGNVGIAQALGVVIDSADLLKDTVEVQFVIVGDGVELEKLEKEASDRGLGNILFLGRKPYQCIASYLACADVLLIHLMRNPMYEITIPSKTYTYLASGRPILVAASGDVAELIQGIDAGMVVPPEDPVALAGAVKKLYSMPVSHREAFGQNAKRAFIDLFDRNVLIRRFETVFSSAMEQKTS